jgi:2-(3-amino-3-carboxypropyl)histidine synthase
MKTLFIPAKRKFNLNFSDLDLNKLPKNLAIAYSIQYKETADKIIKYLSKNKKYNIFNIGQILGCSKINKKLNKNIEALLLIGNGRFHAISLSLTLNKLPIYILEENKISLISEKETESLEKLKKASYLKFLNADLIGILISTKPGQQNLKKAIKVKNFPELKNKKTYFFIGNEVSLAETENFPQIQSWVNTACLRLDMVSPCFFNLNIIN